MRASILLLGLVTACGGSRSSDRPIAPVQTADTPRTFIVNYRREPQGAYGAGTVTMVWRRSGDAFEIAYTDSDEPGSPRSYRAPVSSLGGGMTVWTEVDTVAPPLVLRLDCKQGMVQVHEHGAELTVGCDAHTSSWSTAERPVSAIVCEPPDVTELFTSQAAVFADPPVERQSVSCCVFDACNGDYSGLRAH